MSCVEAALFLLAVPCVQKRVDKNGQGMGRAGM